MLNKTLIHNLLPTFWIIFLPFCGCVKDSGENHGRKTAGRPIITTITKSVESDNTLSDPPEMNITALFKEAEKAVLEYENGEYQKSLEIISHMKNNSNINLLKARIASAKGEVNVSRTLYNDIIKEFPSVKVQMLIELAKTIASEKKYIEAIRTLKLILDNPDMKNELTFTEFFNLNNLIAEWFFELGDFDAATSFFEKAYGFAKKKEDIDKININLAKILIKKKERKKARAILEKTAMEGSTSRLMKTAILILEKENFNIQLSHEQKMKRAEKFVKLRDYKSALKTLEPLLKNSAPQSKASFLNAKIQFNRRRHYKEAVKAFTPFLKSRNNFRRDLAAYLRARALSRLDRDEQAIREFKKIAKRGKGKYKNLSIMALARLQFYTGKYKQAIYNFEKLTKKSGSPDASQIRDAHFMAGLCAFLIKKYKPAVRHFIKASTGSKHPGALFRNQYWRAAAMTLARMKNGPRELRKICLTSPTSYYAYFAKQRLEKAGKSADACKLLPVVHSGEHSQARDWKWVKIMLEKISQKAAFFARAGFFKETVKFLKSDLKNYPQISKDQKAALFLMLKAPTEAVKIASLGLKWPPVDSLHLAKAAYPLPYLKVVKEVTLKHGLPQNLIYAIARKESLFNPDAVSYAGALGIMQMMPATYSKNAKKAGLLPLKKNEVPGPVESIRAAAFELSFLLKKYSNSLPLAIMAYNAGTKAADHWLKRSGKLPLDVFVEKAGFTQTRNYVKRVTKNLIRYNLLSSLPIPVLDMPPNI